MAIQGLRSRRGELPKERQGSFSGGGVIAQTETSGLGTFHYEASHLSSSDSRIF